MMYEVRQSSAFKKQLKLLRKRGYDMDKLAFAIEELRHGRQLEPKFRDHALRGNFRGYRECHIAPDWLLVYRIEKDTLVLLLHRTGTHSDLF